MKFKFEKISEAKVVQSKNLKIQTFKNISRFKHPEESSEIQVSEKLSVYPSNTRTGSLFRVRQSSDALANLPWMELGKQHRNVLTSK